MDIAVWDDQRAAFVFFVENMALCALEALVVGSGETFAVENCLCSGHALVVWVCGVLLIVHGAAEDALAVGSLGVDVAALEGRGVLHALGVVVFQVVAFVADLALLVVFGGEFEAAGESFFGVCGRSWLFEASCSVWSQDVAVETDLARVFEVQFLAIAD